MKVEGGGGVFSPSCDINFQSSLLLNAFFQAQNVWKSTTLPGAAFLERVLEMKLDLIIRKKEKSVKMKRGGE